MGTMGYCTRRPRRLFVMPSVIENLEGFAAKLLVADCYAIGEPNWYAHCVR